MKFKHLIPVAILSLYCSFSEASEHKILNFIEFYKTTQSDVEQYLKTNKCKYKVNNKNLDFKGYRKFKTITVSNCFNLPKEKESDIELIYLNSINDFVVDEVQIKYTNKNNTFDKYQKQLKKKYGTPKNEQISRKDQQLIEWENKNFLVTNFTFGEHAEILYSGLPDGSIDDFNYELLDNNSLLGFIELNKTPLNEVDMMLYRLNCFYEEKEGTSLGVKTKSLVVHRCFFLPKLKTIHISAVDNGTSSTNIVDEVSFSYHYDIKHHNLYVQQIKSKYGNFNSKSANLTTWDKNKFSITIREPLKNMTLFQDTSGNIKFQSKEKEQLLLDAYDKIKKETNSLDSL